MINLSTKNAKKKLGSSGKTFKQITSYPLNLKLVINDLIIAD